MAEDKDGHFMYLEVSKNSKDSTDYKKIADYFIQNCKKVAVDNDEPDTSYWENNYFFYTLTKNDKKVEKILSFDVQGNKNSEWIDVTEIELSIYNKTYIQKMKKSDAFSPGYLFWKHQP